MKLSQTQLEQHLLKKKFLPVYIISSDEPFLKQDALQFIRKTAKQLGIQERIRLIPEKNLSWEELFTTLNTNSLFNEKRLLELDLREHSPNNIASDVLVEYANNPPADQ